MAGLGISYGAPGGGATSISPASGAIGTVFSVNLVPGATCQWYLNGTAISGATSASYTSTATGALTCVVTLGAATVTAAAVVLNALTLSTTSFAAGLAAGTALATISGLTSGSTVSIAATDTSGEFAVSSGGTQLLAGLNYGNLTPGATPTVALTETLAAATNSPHTTDIGVAVVNGATVVSASNRTRLSQSLQTETGKTTNLWNYNRVTHYSVKAATGLQACFWNGYFASGTYAETACPSPVTIRMSWLTNLIGTSNIVNGGSGPPQNQTGCTIATATFSQLANASGSASDVAKIRDINFNLQGYSAFVAAGGSISTNVTANDSATLPGGWSVETDPGPNISAGGYYMTQVEQNIPVGATGSGVLAFVYQQLNNSSLREDGTGTNSIGDYCSEKGAQYALVTDPNWTNYAGVSPTALTGILPIYIRGMSVAGAKSIVVDGASEDFGVNDNGDPNGTCGTIQRACILAGYPCFNTGVAGSSLQTSKSNGGYAYRLGFAGFATGTVITGADLNAQGLGWPTAGTFTTASPDNTTTPTNLMAGSRWWNNKLRTKLPSGGKIGQATWVVGPLGGITDTLSVTSMTASGTTIGSTVTVTTASAHGFSVGTQVEHTGSTTSGYNQTGSPYCVTITSVPSSTTYTYTTPTALGATTAAGTILVSDGYQSYALQQQPTSANYLPGGVCYLHNDYLMQRNSYAGMSSSYSAANGDPDFAVDMRHACGQSEGSTSPANLWAPGPTFRSATVDSGHMGYYTAGVAAPLLAQQILGAIG